MENNLNKRSELKWFTVNLSKDKFFVLHSGHWGTEFLVPNVLKEDITFIKSVTPDETDFDQYQY